MLSDYLGRVRVLTWTILLFAVFTGLCALAQGYWDLLVYRTIAGLGLGGEFGIGMALVGGSLAGQATRARLSYVGLGWQAGVLAAALVTPLLLPVDRLARHVRGRPLPGHRRVLHPARLSGADAVPEQVVRREARRIAEAAGEGHRKPRKVSLGMLILCSVQNFGYYGVMIWLPSYLSTRFGFGLTQSAHVDRGDDPRHGVRHLCVRPVRGQGRPRPAFLTLQAGAAIMVVVYSQLTDATALLIGGAVMGMFVNGMLGGYGALMCELYPTEARATAENVLFNLGRGVGGFGRWWSARSRYVSASTWPSRCLRCST